MISSLKSIMTGHDDQKKQQQWAKHHPSFPSTTRASTALGCRDFVKL